MEVFQLDEFTRGWFVGDFTPTLVSTPEAEVAIMRYRAGDTEASHHHKVALEITAVVSGSVRMSGQVYRAGQIVRISPGESTDFTALEDSMTVVVKVPSVKGDKYFDAPAPQ